MIVTLPPTSSTSMPFSSLELAVLFAMVTLPPAPSTCMPSLPLLLAVTLRITMLLFTTRLMASTFVLLTTKPSMVMFPKWSVEV